MRSLRLTISLLAIGVILGFLGGRGLISSVLPPKYIYAEDCDWTKLKAGQRVVAELDFVVDPFEETTEDGKSVSCLYTVPDLREGSDGLIYMTHFMGVRVNSKDYAAYDKLVEDSWDWWDMEYEQLGERGTIPFDGYLRKMKTNEKQFLEEYLEDAGYADDEIAEMITPYVMMPNQTPIANILMFLGGILALGGGVVSGIISFVKK